MASWSLTQQQQQLQLHCSGSWCLAELPAELTVAQIVAQAQNSNAVLIDAEQIEHFDLGAAIFFTQLQNELQQQAFTVSWQHLAAQHQHLLQLVATVNHKPLPPLPMAKYGLTALGEYCCSCWQMQKRFLNFLGLMAASSLEFCRKPRVALPMVAHLLQTSGANAIPIVGLLSLLIGVVLTYQMGVQLQAFGANVFIVELLGIAVFREFAPLITAIIVAARSGCSFTAEIGTMQLNEELDALQAMGISPIVRVVLPKIVALVITLPLLTVWAAFCSVLGGMGMASLQLGVSPSHFLARFAEVVVVDHFILGLIKAPVFAVIIAAIGSYRGLQVTHSASSIGQQTTHSVVNAIFLIIVLDALFSVLFSLLGL